MTSLSACSFAIFGLHQPMASINQNRYPNLLPNFRNLGVMLRLLVIVIAMTFVAAALKSSNWYDMLDQWLGISTLAQPMVILSLLLLALADRWLHKLDYPLAVAVIVAGELGVASLMVIASWAVFTPGTPGLERSWFFTAVATLLVLAYFNLRSRMLSPALTEARLQALQARIRPHFLFNSINAVLSLVRSEPRRAETALEDLADLFRVLMADNRDLVPLVREVELLPPVPGAGSAAARRSLAGRVAGRRHAGRRAGAAAVAATAAGERGLPRHRAVDGAGGHQHPHLQ